MAEDSSSRRAPDTYRINTREQAEVNYWTRQLGVTREQLLSAVRAVGDSEDKVRQHLARGETPAQRA
jgi:hypothetical protein